MPVPRARTMFTCPSVAMPVSCTPVPRVRFAGIAPFRSAAAGAARPRLRRFRTGPWRSCGWDGPGVAGRPWTAAFGVPNKRRGGKTVTVVFGLPNNAAFLKDLAQQLKRACGTGGTATDEGVELQGDLRE